METRGRKKKITVEDVVDYIKENQPVTKDSLALNLDVCSATIRNRLKEARDDGLVFLHDSEGLHFCEVVDDNNKNLILDNGDWIVGIMIGMARIGKGLKKPLIQARKITKLTNEEKKQLKKTLLLLNRLVDEIMLDDELED